VSRNHSVAAGRGTIDDVILPHATRLRTADKVRLRSLRNEKSRALAMLRNKHVEMPGRKHDNFPV
jgi:propionyl-CoA carboxylase beta subunit